MNIIRTLILLAGCLAVGSPVTAQTAGSLPRFDAAGYLGLYSAHKPGFDDYRNWYTSLFGAGSLGFYWNDHWKTEIEAGAATPDEIFEYRQLQTGQDFVYINHTIQATGISIGQHYQFFRNAWFHPSLGAGLTLTLERDTQQSQLYLTGPARPPGAPPLPQPVQTSGRETDARVNPFVTTGFKAYMTRTSFFRSDLKVAFGKSAQDVTIRFGVGVDF